MLKALLVKELRETIGIVLLALLAHVYFVSGSMGIRLLPFFVGGYREIPFVGDAFVGTFAFVSVGLALALGFRQSVGESAFDTYLFLLHRPASWRRLIGTKLLVGAALYLVCSAVPILAYAWWAATPGTHASPFEWSMTAPAWKVWITMTILYLGAFLSGIRPGRWKGTRLLPVPAVGLIVVFVQFVPWWLVLGLSAVLLMDVVLVASIFFVARTRDF